MIPAANKAVTALSNRFHRSRIESDTALGFRAKANQRRRGLGLSPNAAGIRVPNGFARKYPSNYLWRASMGDGGADPGARSETRGF